MRTITKLIIHCAATPPDMDIGVAEIRRWHTDLKPTGNGWRDVGYHYVIRRDGTLETGRPEAQQGAHCAARNGNVASIGICLVGGVRRVGKKLEAENNFEPAQWLTLELLVKRLQKKHRGIDTILGHRDLDPGKACPSFSVREWLAREALKPQVWPDFSNVISRLSSTEAIAPAR